MIPCSLLLAKHLFNAFYTLKFAGNWVSANQWNRIFPSEVEIGSTKENYVFNVIALRPTFPQSCEFVTLIFLPRNLFRTQCVIGTPICWCRLWLPSTVGPSVGWWTWDVHFCPTWERWGGAVFQVPLLSQSVLMDYLKTCSKNFLIVQIPDVSSRAFFLIVKVVMLNIRTLLLEFGQIFFPL